MSDKKRKNKNIKTKEKNYKKIVIVIILVLIIVGITFFIKKFNIASKNSKIGNNSTSQEIVDYILNVSSYETEIEVEVKSNKNSNKYKIRQKYINNENNEQEILEPSNIQGIKIIREKGTLTLKNRNLNLVKVFEDYDVITNNALDLSVFLKEYKGENKNQVQSTQIDEDSNYIILTVILDNSNTYIKEKNLYINKTSGLIERMEMLSANKTERVNIIYNEVEILN